MAKSRWIGLFFVGFGLVGSTMPAAAQYPGLAQPAPVQPAPAHVGQVSAGQTLPGQPFVVQPHAGQVYGPAPAGNPPVYAGPQNTYPAPVEGGGYVVDGGAPVVVGGQGQVVGAEGQPIPYSENFGNGPQGLGYPGIISNDGGDQLYPYDQQDPWLHGYWQEIPAYGGYSHFRPYNYKHVLSQTQAAAGWGLDPTMAYSQQFWHRYQERASLEHCPVPGRALESPNAELDPRVEADRLRREVEDRERRLRNLERNGF